MSEPGKPPKDNQPEIPKGPAPLWLKAFHLIHIGSSVWWYDMADRELEPLCGIVVAKYKESKSIDVILWSKGMRTAYGTREGLRHIDDPGANDHQKKEVGAWVATPETLALLKCMEK